MLILENYGDNKREAEADIGHMVTVVTVTAFIYRILGHAGETLNMQTIYDKMVHADMLVKVITFFPIAPQHVRYPQQSADGHEGTLRCHH